MPLPLPDLLVRATAALALAVVPSLLAVDHVVVASQATAGDAAWGAVVAALETKHQGQRVLFAKDAAEVVPQLKALRPRFVAFVMQPGECTKEFIVSAHQFLRTLDDDPYADALWGVVTGVAAADALAMVTEKEPLVIRKVAAGTEISLAHCEEGVWFSELKAGQVVRKTKGAEPAEEKGPADSVKAVVDTLNDWKPDLFITSGHATEHDWQPGYSYRNGSFRSKAGRLTGHDLEGKEHPVKSPNPKVYLPVGNCLIGHIDGPDCMALAWMRSGGVRQMAGYIEPTWFGYMGWGCLDYFLEQPGRYSVAEAFFANEAALIHKLVNLPAGDQGDRRGLEFDRDHVAFYGDPAWEARMAPGPLQWRQSLRAEDGRIVIEVVPLQGDRSFATVNTNGSQRGGRPFVQFLPERIDPATATVVEGGEWRPSIADDFVLIPRPQGPAKNLRVVIGTKGKP